MGTPESKSKNKPVRSRTPLRGRLKARRARKPRKKNLYSPIDSAPHWEVNAAWTLKVLIGVAILGEFIYEDYLYGLWGIAAFAIVFLPIQFARSNKAVLPVEFEIILLLILTFDIVLGRFFHLYDRISFYDKLIHYHDSLLIAFSGFIMIYSLYFTGRIKVSPLIGGVVILFVTVGFGGIWEIMEYTADKIFGQGAQGSPILSPLDDTMTDLMFDLLGGAVGAVAGSYYIRFSQRTRRRRFYEIMDLLGGESGG